MKTLTFMGLMSHPHKDKQWIGKVWSNSSDSTTALATVQFEGIFTWITGTVKVVDMFLRF